MPSRRAALRAVALAAAAVAAPGLSHARAAVRRGPPVARIEPVTESTEQFKRYIAHEVTEGTELLKAAGFRPE